jgi:hypothetical protein
MGRPNDFNVRHASEESEPMHSAPVKEFPQLPAEILSEIFLCLPKPVYEGPYTKHLDFFTPLRVSRLWRRTALTTPEIWTTLSFTVMSNRKDDSSLLSTWLKRSKPAFLDMTIYFHTDYESNGRVKLPVLCLRHLEIIISVAPRLKHLALSGSAIVLVSIASSLYRSTSLETLQLSEITEEGEESLADEVSKFRPLSRKVVSLPSLKELT